MASAPRNQGTDALAKELTGRPATSIAKAWPRSRSTGKRWQSKRVAIPTWWLRRRFPSKPWAWTRRQLRRLHLAKPAFKRELISTITWWTLPTSYPRTGRTRLIEAIKPLRPFASEYPKVQDCFHTLYSYYVEQGKNDAAKSDLQGEVDQFQKAAGVEPNAGDCGTAANARQQLQEARIRRQSPTLPP